MRFFSRTRCGVTLVELLVVMAIMATLVGVMLPGVQAVRRAAEYTEHLSWLHQRRIGDPPPRKTMRVVFVGNSRTYWNDIPGIVVELGRFAGTDITTKIVVEGGKTLEWHWNAGDAQAAIAEDWTDFVVLQEGRGASATQDKNALLYQDYATRFIQLCKSDAVPLLYATWASHGTAAELQTRITETAFGIARQPINVNSEVCVVGEAWQRSIREKPEVELYEDDVHPNTHGAYLAACVFHATFHRTSPEGLPYALTTRAGVSISIDPDTARYFQKIAWETVEAFRERSKPYYLQAK